MKKSSPLELGSWMPDLPILRQQTVLAVCENVIPVPGGYAVAPSLSNLDSNALSAAPRGAIRGQLSDGTNFYFAGTASTLERFTESGWTDVSRAAGYTTLTQDRWSAAKFGSSVFFVNRRDETQAFDTASDTLFGNVTGAPRAGIAASSENFLWLGDIVSSTLGVARDGVAWSAVSAPYTWPTPGTDEATAVLSGEQRLEGDGGFVNGIISGAEVTAIFQENAIHRADFVGNDVVWQIDRVETEHGLMVKEAAVALPKRRILFLASDGWRVFNYTSSENIGKGVVNDYFFAEWDQDYPDQVTMLRDPTQTRVYVSYPATGNSGVPNRILVWDWALNRWSLIKPGNHYMLVPAGGIAPSLDAPATTGDPDANALEDSVLGSTSFDDRLLSAGRVSMGAFDSSFRLATFSGRGLLGKLETGDLELNPGWRSLLSSVRPQVDGEEATVQVAGLDRRPRSTDSVTFGDENAMAADGNCYPRVDARYHRIRLNLPATLTAATSMDYEATRTGKR